MTCTVFIFCTIANTRLVEDLVSYEIKENIIFLRIWVTATEMEIVLLEDKPKSSDSTDPP